MAVPRQPPISMVTITRTSDYLVHVLPRALPSSPAFCSFGHKISTKCCPLTVLTVQRLCNGGQIQLHSQRPRPTEF